jgi:hypothetical protein
MKHEIRHKDGGFVEIEKLTRAKAIKLHCTECCGYEYHPGECEIKECALWPFRGKSLKAILRPKTSDSV